MVEEVGYEEHEELGVEEKVEGCLEVFERHDQLELKGVCCID